MDNAVISGTIDAIKRKCGPGRAEFAEKGVNQVARLWREEDGSGGEFAEFCEKNFIADNEELKKTLKRLEDCLEQIFGHSVELQRFLTTPLNVDQGTFLPIDLVLATYAPDAHLTEDLFGAKVAFFILLNFEVIELKEYLEKGLSFSREKWAEGRLTEICRERIPASALQKISKAGVAAEDYISKLNFYVHNLIMPAGLKPFPENAKWQSHWELRDHLRQYYSSKDGLPYQEILYKIMHRVIEQSVPKIVIDNPNVKWNPFTNDVFDSEDKPLSNEDEDNERYGKLFDFFLAEKDADQHRSGNKNYIGHIFENFREIPEEEFEKLMVYVLESPVAKAVGSLIKNRLGRPLWPFDIWYEFDSGNQDFGSLDQKVKQLYPDPRALKADLSNILGKFGFSKKTAKFLASHIFVEVSRTSGHCCGASRREDNVYFRVRFGKDGLDCQGFVTVMHELFHAVQMVFSLHTIDHTLLSGVPAGHAVTEAFAFFGQEQSLRILDAEEKNEEKNRNKVLKDFWNTFEMAGIGLLDLNIWRWMYQNEKASRAELKEAVEHLAKDIWNDYFAPVFGIKNEPILAIYSHIINCGLYTPDYFLGHVICSQITEYLKKCRRPAKEIERMCKIGNITPDIWMRQAVDGPISAKPLIEAVEKALLLISPEK